jgi:hypothetical protein
MEKIKSFKFWLNENKLTNQEIEEILKKLKIQDKEELEKIEELFEIDDEELIDLNEASGVSKEHKVSSDTKGKLHEILTGYHLRGGKHMEKHPDKHGDTPKEAHDKLKASIHPNDYKKINERAKSAANDIKHKVEKNGHKIHDVHWTSQPNDLLRSTGIKATQKEDSSDIVVTTHKNKKIKHHGISLKVTDSASKHVPTSNLGLKSLGPKAESTLDQHRRTILKKFPKLGTHATNKKQRKEMLKKHPKMANFIKNKNHETLHKMAKDLHNHLITASKKDLVEHVKKVIHSHQTPMQKEGHEHMRHVSYVSNGKNIHHSIDPSNHHEHIFKDSKNISVEHHGSSLHFKHKGKTFARHSMKFSSQSDPMSSIKSSGQTAGD